MNSPCEPAATSAKASQLLRLRAELREVTQACAEASRCGQAGNLFFLSRKKWRLMQELFEAEHQTAGYSAEPEEISPVRA